MGRTSYPYPTNPSPTPHQIFHLSPGASQKEIKTRYYELVRAHHPDSILCRSLSPQERHARFQAITAAYDVLRGRSQGFTPHDPYREEVLRRKHFYQAHQSRRSGHTYAGQKEWSASPDDRWKDNLILAAGILTLAAGLVPGLFMLPYGTEKRHQTAVLNLKQAKSDAQEYGEERRTELRKRVRDINEARRNDA